MTRSIKLTEEEEEFARTLRRLFEAKVSSSYLRSRIEGAVPSDPDLWTDLCGLGLFEFFSDTSLGDLRALSIVAEECGRSLVPENILEALFFGPYLLSRYASDPAEAVTYRILRGESLACGALLTDLSRPGISTLDLVRGARPAEWLVLWRDQGAHGTLEIHARNLAGQAPEPLDRTIRCDAVSLADPYLCFPTDRIIGDTFLALKAAEIYGAAAKAHEMTLEYAKTRTQFGVAIGSFQAVQHGLAETYLKLESLRALTRFATWAASNSPGQFPLAANAAFAHATLVGPSIVETAIQLHGGIGFTWEYDLHLYLRRVKMIEALYGPREGEYERILEYAMQ
jgi:alkylation response protein AidB-like acyl-CoA dehydrogenase